MSKDSKKKLPNRRTEARPEVGSRRQKQKIAASSVEQTIDYKIGRLRKALDRYSAPIVTSYGLTLAEWRVLTHIRAGTAVTASWLCDRLLADRAEVSRACASLIDQGLVASKPNPADARSSLLRLTVAGKAKYTRIIPARLALDAELAALLIQSENEALRAMLDTLTAFMLLKIADTQGSTDPKNDN